MYNRQPKYQISQKEINRFKKNQKKQIHLKNENLSQQASSIINISRKQEKEKEKLKDKLKLNENTQKHDEDQYYEKLKQNQGFKFLLQLQKKKEIQIQIIQLEKEIENVKKQMSEKYKNAHKIDEYNKSGKVKCYKIIKNDKVIFNETNMCINLKQNYGLNSKQQKVEVNNPIDSKNKTAQSTLFYLEEDIVIESTHEVIQQKQKYIHLIDSSIDQLLHVDSKYIYQLQSLLKHDDRFLSNRLTKCIYFVCQMVLAITTQILLYEQVEEKIYMEYLNQNFDFHLLRLLSITFISYSIPYFVFGMLTNIFAQSSKQFIQIDFRSINKLRGDFINCYIILGAVQIILYLALILYYSNDHILFKSFSLSSHVFEVIFSFVINTLLIDTIFYCIHTIFLSDKQKSESGFINNFLACRGYYYYKGFDNFVVYEQYFLSLAIKSI